MVRDHGLRQPRHVLWCWGYYRGHGGRFHKSGRMVCGVRKDDALRPPGCIDTCTTGCVIRRFDQAVGCFCPGLPCPYIDRGLFDRRWSWADCLSFEQWSSACGAQGIRLRRARGPESQRQTRRHLFDEREKVEERSSLDDGGRQLARGFVDCQQPHGYARAVGFECTVDAEVCRDAAALQSACEHLACPALG